MFFKNYIAIGKQCRIIGKWSDCKVKPLQIDVVSFLSSTLTYSYTMRIHMI